MIVQYNDSFFLRKKPYLPIFTYVFYFLSRLYVFIRIKI